MTVDSTASRSLSRSSAHAMWLQLLARQGLAGGIRPTCGHEAIERSVGLHAARRPSPFTTLLARVHDQRMAEIIYRPGPPDDLVTVRCMRKTLHVLPRRLAGWAHTATRHFRERDARRQATNAGVDPHQVRSLVDAVRSELVSGEALSHRAIEERLLSRGVERSHARAGLKLAWEAGHLVYVNASQHWNRESRRFYLSDRVAPDITPHGCPHTAANNLVEAYLDAYGPASLRDMTWWSGLSATRINAALNNSARPVHSVTTPWATSPLYFFADSMQATGEQVPFDSSAVDFLAHEDVALKAYHETRRRYLGDRDARQAFNQIGEVRPTIVRDGAVAGEWWWDEPAHCVRWRLFEHAGKRLRDTCDRRADFLTSALRVRHDLVGRPDR